MTIMANGAGRTLEDLFAKIAAVNDAGTETIRMVTPLMPGEAHDMRGRLRSRHPLCHRGDDRSVITTTTPGSRREARLRPDRP
jgi:hypothetical protein